MKTVFLIRHIDAESDPVSPATAQKAEEQITTLTNYFKHKPFDRIYSSPLESSLETIRSIVKSEEMEIITDTRLGDPLQYNQDAKDGKKQSMDVCELTIKGKEFHANAMENAAAVLEYIIKSDDHRVVVISHSELTTIMLYYLNSSFLQLMDTNPDVFEIVIVNKEATLKRIREKAEAARAAKNK